MICLGNVTTIDFQQYDEVWYITNHNPKMVIGAEHHSELAPFYPLYKSYRSNDITLSQLLQEYGNALWSHKYDRAIEDLLCKSNSGSWILLICYCDNADACHRGVLFKYLSNLTDNVQLIN